MDDPAGVRGGEPVRDLTGDLGRALWCDRTGAQTVGEVLSLEELGDGVRDPAVFARVVDREDVRMVESRHGPRLPLEASQGLGVVCPGLGQDLQRDLAPQPDVARPVHLSHSTFAERSDDLVWPG